MKSAHLTAIAAAWVCVVIAAACEGKSGGPAAAHQQAPASAASAPAPDAPSADAVDAAPTPADQAPLAPTDDAAREPITCQSAAKNLIAVMEPELQKQLAKLPEAERAEAEKKMRASVTVESLQAQCLAEKLGPAELRCITNAKTSDDLQACRTARGGGAAPVPGGAGE